VISFSKLGNYGRLGNQLFQYAFLRAQAKRLGTKFYCPEWLGDTIFNLNDEKEKGGVFTPDFIYDEKGKGFHPDTNEIKDGTEITGFFQSDRYFTKEDIFKWFTFREEVFTNVNRKYDSIDFSHATAIHIRLGDYATPQIVFYTPRKFYFKNALNKIKNKESILVFSDEPKAAEKYLKNIEGNFIFMEGNTEYEDLYLISKCRNVICSPSSFSWWASYLSRYEDKQIIVPEYWFLPGGKAFNNDIFVDGWMRLKAHAWYDYYPIRFIPNKIEVYYRRILKIIRLFKEGGIKKVSEEIKKFLGR
jgi:hypothetical protein